MFEDKHVLEVHSHKIADPGLHNMIEMVGRGKEALEPLYKFYYNRDFIKRYNITIFLTIRVKTVTITCFLIPKGKRNFEILHLNKEWQC